MANETKLPLQLTEEESLKELAGESDLVFIGTVQNLGKPAANWSGFFTEYQQVKYGIDRVLKGTYGAGEITVDHVLVSGSKTAASTDKPGLSSRLFEANAKLIISARKSPSGAWKSLDENFGALPATEEWVKKVEAAVGVKK